MINFIDEVIKGSKIIGGSDQLRRAPLKIAPVDRRIVGIKIFKSLSLVLWRGTFEIGAVREYKDKRVE